MEFGSSIMVQPFIYAKLVTMILCKHSGSKSQNDRSSHDAPYFIHEGMDP